MAFPLKPNTGKQVGMTDLNSCHVDDDKFEIKNYVHGLRDFIMTCNTPMTIAIQGDWGTGKTSIMEMVIDDINSSQDNMGGNTITPVKFNTWEYSQFNLASQLPMIMIDALVNQIKAEVAKRPAGDDVIKKLKGYSDKIGDFVSVFATVSLSMVTKGMVQLDSGNIKSLLPNGSVNGISELKNNFSKVISTVASGEKDKVVIFIDDLDRLDPALAVEILEVLKIFLESPKCVFVLAIDYSVVQRGVKAKYGKDFDDEKGRNFFDKIIQVPFQVPVGNYDLKKFFDSCVDETDIAEELKKKSDKLITLIETSVGKNPRAIKRLFNALLLLQMVDQNNEKSTGIFKDGDKLQMLFAMMCLQQACQPVYDYFSLNRDDIDADKFNVLMSMDVDAINHSLDIEVKPEELEKIKRFIPELKNLIVRNETVSDSDLSILKDVLALSVITGNTEPIAEKKKVALPVDRSNLKHEKYSLEQVNHILDLIDSIIANNPAVSVKYINTKGYGHAEYRINKKKFIDVIFYDDDREWVEIGCIPNDVVLWDKPDLSAICEKRSIMKGISYFYSRGISFKYKFGAVDDSQDDDLRTSVKACFEDVLKNL